MTQPVRIPADVDREDRVIGPLTARQLLIVTVAGLVLYGAYLIMRLVLPLLVILIILAPIGAIIAFLALGRRDGIPLDKLVLAAVRQRMSPRHHVAAPEGIRPAPEWLARRVTTAGGDLSDVSPAALRLPAEAITDAGVIDLGEDGVAVVAVASTVNFSLRTPAEQEGLVTAFGRYLHSLTAPVQVLVRAERLDLSGKVAELRDQAGRLPHPALEAAAREHADYQQQLARAVDLLRRQILLVLREPLRTSAAGRAWTKRRAANEPAQFDDTIRRAAEARLARRLGEAAELLAPAGITVTPLDAGQATGVLAAACNPDSLIPPSAGLAAADEVITTAPEDSWDPTAFGQPAFTPEATDDWDNEDVPDVFERGYRR